MRASYGMTHITPDHIAAWEREVAAPNSNELVALAGALWCTPRDLMGEPRTLHEHRIARGIPVEDIAHAVGIDVHDYVRMEESGRWSGNRFQVEALGRALGLSGAELFAVTGQEEQLAQLLTEAVSTRWQAHIKEVETLVGLEKRDLKGPLRTMHTEYQTLITGTLSRAGGAASSGDAGRNYLDRLVPRFWELVQQKK
ncbi:hypothetical protein SRB5_13930 [Streptomyces sp. RB5]|uniref:HTH cro/C1-type domain-containing protein n=1 Tax=Streptomyces smaragdinus TaxID=2585196 RepID=A0A7K0CCU3_9ACTN|nr:helix-turn-helix transcriptional regulator [Streptomyces smaragdinus]MQY11278.1 hypothetical protein [Streptomyces smaragdinus]